MIVSNVSEISDQTQWSMCFHNNLKSGFREMSTSSIQLLFDDLCFISCQKQSIIWLLFKHKAIMYTTTISRIYVLQCIRSIEISRLNKLINFLLELDWTRTISTRLDWNKQDQMWLEQTRPVQTRTKMNWLMMKIQVGDDVIYILLSRSVFGQNNIILLFQSSYITSRKWI